jgi:TonB-dependent receptor
MKRFGKTALLLCATATSIIFAAAQAHAQAQSAPGDAVQPASGEDSDIVVTGTRAGQRKAVAEKRDADNTLEALYANDVGKLPDQNVAEAVKRLPGVTVANDQGEGRYVIIRGIDPNLVNVAINGQTMPAPEPDGRVVKLDDIPSAMINAVTVSKSLLPSQDANAIGGEVNIRTLTAFDRTDHFFADARGSVGYFKLNGKSPYEIDGQVGGRFGDGDRLGLVLSANYSRRPIESENYQGSEDYVTYSGVPTTNGLRDYNLVRERLGLVGNFDWHLSDGVKLYVRSSYSKFTDHETRDQNRLALTAPPTIISATTGKAAATGTILVRRREEDDNTKSVTAGGDVAIGGGGQLEFSGGWTKAVKVDPIRSEFTFTTKKGSLTADYDLGTDPYTMVPEGNAFTNASLFTLSKYNFEHRNAFEELWQGRADLTLPVALGNDSTIKLGVKYVERHKADDHDKLDYKPGSTSWNIGNVAYTGDTGFYDGMFTFGDRIDYFAGRDYVAANPGVVKLDTAGTLADSLSSDYDVRESILAGYAMATLKFGALTIIPGVRVEHTEDKTKAKVVNAASTLTDPFNSFGSKSYTDFFPGVNAKLELERNLLLRGAVTTSIGRPNYPDLAPYVVVEDDIVPNIAIGNSALKPYRAVNLDASLEYYPSKDSVLSVGLFYKHIDDPIFTTIDRVTNGTYGGVVYPLADVTQPINLDQEVIGGIELNAQTQFTRLPGFLSGFGISANYTHVEGHATAPAFRPGNIPLFDQSSDSGTVQLFYEKYGFAARIAYSYRSPLLDLLGGAPAADEYTDLNGQLDVHMSYQILPQVTVFGDATNLTDAPWRRYIATKSQLVERERYDFALRGGIQLHF